MRVALPPSAGASQRSPSQLKTRACPSGVREGYWMRPGVVGAGGGCWACAGTRMQVGRIRSVARRLRIGKEGYSPVGGECAVCARWWPIMRA